MSRSTGNSTTYPDIAWRTKRIALVCKGTLDDIATSVIAWRKSLTHNALCVTWRKCRLCYYRTHQKRWIHLKHIICLDLRTNISFFPITWLYSHHLLVCIGLNDTQMGWMKMHKWLLWIIIPVFMVALYTERCCTAFCIFKSIDVHWPFNRFCNICLLYTLFYGGLIFL